MPKKLRSMQEKLRLLALASKVYDDVFFRALLRRAESVYMLTFSKDNLQKIADVTGGKISLTQGGSIAYLKNERGLAIKFTERDGNLSIDDYYSYPARDFSKAEKKAARSEVKNNRAFSQVRSALADAKRERASRRSVKIAQFVTGALCMVIGFLLVQLTFDYLIGHYGVDYASVFASLFAGLILYTSLGEFILHIAIRNYGERQGFGDGGRQYESYLIAFGFDVVLHGLIYIFMPHAFFTTVVILASFIFFIFPGTYLVNTLWGMKKEVVEINTCERLINRRYYTNVPDLVRREELLPVTISLAVYLEENEIIFDNLRGCVEAAKVYTKESGQTVNIIVSDDGLMRMFDGVMDDAGIAKAIESLDSGKSLSELRGQGAERIQFYREHGVAFVARPLEGRRGKFKKGGNLNFSYRLARGEGSGGYAEGEIVYHDIILTLDKDSGVAPGVIAPSVSEFIRDPKLVYAQGITEPANPEGNYFTRIMRLFFYMLQYSGLPSKGLQGLSVPLMGHNAFLRRSFIDESGMWAEDRVSEDFAKSVDAHNMGYHGKYLAYKGLEFTEYVCDTFAEETGKQLRYCYGLTEMIFLSHKQIRKLPKYHWCDIGSYFCSHINIAAIIPTYLILLRYDIFHLLFGGIIVNTLLYFFVPIVLASKMQKRQRFKGVVRGIFGFALIGLTFFAHNYSIMRAFFEFALDRIRAARGRTPAPLPASIVITKSGTAMDGWRLLLGYYRKNSPAAVCAVLFAANGIRMFTWLNEFVPAVVLPAVAQILYAAALPLLTPQLLGRLPGFIQSKLPKWHMARRWEAK